MYYREGRAGFEQRPRFAKIERDKGYAATERDRGQGAGYRGSEDMGSWEYARSFRASRSRGRLEAGYGGEGTILEEEEIPAVGVFGVANPPYEAPRGRGMFAGGCVRAGGRGVTHGRGPLT